jgi:hypothetical protein
MKTYAFKKAEKLQTASLLILSAVVLFAVFLGALIPFLGLKYSVIFFSAIAGIYLLFVPTALLLYVLVVTIYLVYGMANYFFELNLTWAVYLLSLPIAGGAFLHNLRRGIATPNTSRNLGLSWASVAMLLLIAEAVFSTMLWPPSFFYTFILVFRNYFVLALTMWVFSTGIVGRREITKVAYILMFAVFMQLPLAMYQRIVVVPKRYDPTPWDAVVGTFFGDPTRGGDSGGLAIFLVAMLLGGLIVYRYRMISRARLGMWIVLCISPLLLADVKIILVLLPLALLLAYRKTVLRHPILYGGLFLLGGGAIGLAVIFLSGDVKSGYAGFDLGSVQALTDKLFGFSVGTNVYLSHGEMGRVTGLIFWYQNLPQFGWQHALFGHGVSASWTSPPALGQVALLYPSLHFDNTAAAALLWDTGIIGFLLILVMLLAGAREAYALSKMNEFPAIDRVILEFSGSFLLLLVPIVIYTKAIVGNSLPTQFMMFLSLGIVLWGRRQIRTMQHSS